MKKKIIAVVISLGLLTSAVPAAGAVSLQVDNSKTSAFLSVINNTTYVPLRAVTNLLVNGASISWVNGCAIVKTSNLTLIARPGDSYLEANGRMLYIKDGVKAVNGAVMVPIRVLAKALGASLTWDSVTELISVISGSGSITSGDTYYDSNAVYWLSHIISAESGSEPLAGKLAVGNVVLNRVASADFPDTIYDVIFDLSWGGQFEPVSNGTIYNTPTEESILAAKLCLDGASVVGASLYFLNPAKASNFWAVNNCTYIATIGSHQFYA